MPILAANDPEWSDKPFYWSSHCKCGGDGKCCAAKGWYRWTDRGLQYLGESLLETTD